MDCKYVRQSSCIRFKFHPRSTSLFSLVHYKNRLRILQENLYNGLLINYFPVPLKLQSLDVDNYILNYNEDLKLIVLTLSNYVVLYSVEKKTLELVAQAQGKNPYYILRTVTKDKFLYFSCTEQKNIYAINLQQCIKQGAINNYIKYKLTSEVQILSLAIQHKKLVALCSDSVLRIWDIESGNPLRGAAIEKIGRPFCLNFSQDGQYLLIGSHQGFIQAWDGPTLGYKNTKIMSQKVSTVKIQSLSWFHYSGQFQSHRFLALTLDGSIKLFEFWLQKKDDMYVGCCKEKSLLYINKHKIQEDFQITAHPFANFIFFSPGIMLYMVDIYSLIYYPVVIKPMTYSFEEISPNEKKEVYYQKNYIFMEGLEVQRLTDKIERKISLHNDLQYKQLKILKLDMRPLSIKPSKKYKLMLMYYLKNSVRVFTISNLNLNQQYDSISSYKEYSGSWIMFLGPPSSYNCFIFIIQDDKQTIMVLAEEEVMAKEELQKIENQEEKRYLQLGVGEIYTKKISIKVQKVYQTPFRNGYVVIYQSQNLLRFSANINYESQMINYQVYTGYSLRLDSASIIIDVVWTSKGQLGAVICLDKVVFITCELKFMKSVNINGYVVQGQWIGYTLLVTTKVDIQYLDILSRPLQAFCIENFQTCKYLVLGIMADRIFGIQKTGGKISIKSRYFNLMEPLVAGYLNYKKIVENPIDQILIKRIIQCFAPYYIVSEQFISLLNSHSLSNFSMFFLEGNEKTYSRSIRAVTMNKRHKIERFIKEDIWAKHRKPLLDLFLAYEEAKDSSDPYEKDKVGEYCDKIKKIIGDIAFDSIQSISSQPVNESAVTIDNNFGEKSLIQLYNDYKDDEPIKMEVQAYKAENIGQWIGQFGTYIQSKTYFSEEGPKPIQPNIYEESDEAEENQFRDLVVYCRLDDGKGTIAEDLSDFANDGTIIGEEDVWIGLTGEPMQLSDKWGKKCPPQYALSCIVSFDKKLNCKSFKKGLSIEIWVRPMNQSFNIVKNQRILFSVKGNKFVLFIEQTQVHLSTVEESNLMIGQWTHVALVLDPQKRFVSMYLNSCLSLQGKFDKFEPKPPTSMQIGSDNDGVEYTEFRMWRKVIDDKDIRQNMRTPLEIVAEKRKKLMITLKNKKKKEKKEQKKEDDVNPFALPL